MNKRKKVYTEITLLHVIGATMILLCHFSQKLRISSLGELFISGVPLFLFVSGFLMGKSHNISKIKGIKRRFIRILIPYYLWIIPTMCVLWLSDHSAITKTQGIFLLTNLQGLNYIWWKSEIYSAVMGLGHLWYVTEIVCLTMLSPLFLKIIDKIMISKKVSMRLIVLIVVVIQPLLMCFGFQISYIVTYFLGMLCAKKNYVFNNKNFVQISLICAVITALRFLGMNYLDGTNYYDRYLALVSSAVVGIWIFGFIFWLREKFPTKVDKISNCRIITFLSAISYEIYIVHFWFLNGKWQIQNYIQNWLLADCIVLLLTVIFAWLLSKFSKIAKGVINNV